MHNNAPVGLANVLLFFLGKLYIPFKASCPKIKSEILTLEGFGFRELWAMHSLTRLQFSNPQGVPKANDGSLLNILLQSGGIAPTKCTRARERLWSFSLFSCSFTAWLWLVSLLSVLARTQPRHSSGDSSFQALFPPNMWNYPLSLPFYSHSIVSTSALLPSTHCCNVSLGVQYTHYICCYQNTLMDCKMPLTLFWMLSAENSRSGSSSILEAARYDCSEGS